MQLVQITPPAAEPITLDDAKAFMGILDTESDTLIPLLITAVREHVENVTSRQLESATFELYAESFTQRLPKNPINSITSIEYMDLNGVYQTLDATSYYLYEHNELGHIHYDDIPTVKEHKKAVKITFVCGCDSVPETIKQYMRVMVSTLFENREKYVIGTSISEFGDGYVENLLSSYKVRNV